MSKRSNIPIRIPPIETDLQALIKSVDDAQRGTQGTESTGGRDGPTMNNGEEKRLTVDSGDEKDVIIKLYDPDVVPVQLSRSSSFGSHAAIQSVSINICVLRLCLLTAIILISSFAQKLPASKLCSKSDDGG